MDSQPIDQYTQPMLSRLVVYPGRLPDVVKRVWQAFYHHCDVSSLPPTRRLVAHAMVVMHPELSASVSTIERARREYPDLIPGRFKRGDIPPWMNDRAIWDEYSVPLPLKPDDAAVEVAPFDPAGEQLVLELPARDPITHEERPVEVVADRSGFLRLKLPPTVSVAAAWALGFMLDLVTDGRADGVIRWCRLLLEGTRATMA